MRKLPKVCLMAALAAVPGLASKALGGTCHQAKLLATGKKVAGKLTCQQTAWKTGAILSPTCLSTVETKFLAAFAKAELKPVCTTIGDAAAVEVVVDSCVNALTGVVFTGSPVAPAACPVAKLKAAGKKLAAKLKCHSVASPLGGVPSPTCIATAEAKFTLAIAKADLKSGCTVAGDGTAIESAVDGCLASLVTQLPPPTTTTTATTPSTTTTTTLAGCIDPEPAAFDGMLAAHNAVRASASPAPVPPLDPLCWKNTVAATAQAWADGCNYEHNPDLGSLNLGENIAAFAPPGSATLLDPVGWWAAESSDYDYGTNTCSAVCGHYTQIVWRNTTHVGCGFKECSVNSPFGPGFPNWTLVVCDYSPPGNFIGEWPY